MKPDEFNNALDDLAGAFGKNLDNDAGQKLALQYSREFKHLNAAQWRNLARTASRECERFPTIKTLRDIAHTLGYQQQQAPRLQEQRDQWLTFECVCLTSFAITEPDLITRAQAAHVYECWKCKRSTPYSEIRRLMNNGFATIDPGKAAFYPHAGLTPGDPPTRLLGRSEPQGPPAPNDLPF